MRSTRAATSRLRHLTRLGLAACVAVGVGSSVSPVPTRAAEVTAFDAKVAGTGAIISDDEARFQARHQVRSGASGGIEDFFLQATIGDNRDLKFEGRALLDNHDYLARLLLREEDLGYIDAGYREFRHWYDGSGGYFPPSGAYFSLR